MSLDGRIAFVTGGGSGIGRAVCQILAREGASIIAADKNLQGAQETIGLLPKSSTQSHLALLVFVEKSESVKQSLQEVLKTFSKPPSIVVNSAGIYRPSPITELTEADYNAVLDVNLKGTFLVMQTFANAMIQHNVEKGSIINIGSLGGKLGQVGSMSYCASKAGVDIMSKVAAKEFGKWNIRVNTVLPGFITTPMSDTAEEEVKVGFIAAVALARVGRPEEVAEVVTFLASDKSSYINGASIEVSGGI